MLRSKVYGSAALALTVWMGSIAQGAEPVKDSPVPPVVDATSHRPAEDAAIESALDQVVSVNLAEPKLADLVRLLGEHKIVGVLDTKAFAEAGVDQEEAMHPLSVKQIALRSLLETLLYDLDLTYFVRDAKLFITTTEKESNELFTRIYNVHDLVSTPSASAPQFSYSPLINLLTNVVVPNSWDEVGGPATLNPFQETLVISQTYHVHAEIESTIAALRQAGARGTNAEGPAVFYAVAARQRAALAAFEQKAKLTADFDFKETKLSDVLKALVLCHIKGLGLAVCR